MRPRAHPSEPPLALRQPDVPVVVRLGKHRRVAAAAAEGAALELPLAVQLVSGRRGAEAEAPPEEARELGDGAAEGDGGAAAAVLKEPAVAERHGGPLGEQAVAGRREAPVPRAVAVAPAEQHAEDLERGNILPPGARFHCA